ncbi:MAG: enoyl-CoA hydratase-related protein [Blastomonas sp.]
MMRTVPDLADAELEIENGVAIMRFNRDDVRNELTGTRLAAEIVFVCEWINASREIGTLILTGAGSAFCAGGNIHDMHQRKGMFGGNPMEIQQGYRQGIQRMARAMAEIEVPTIAAINGAAIGAGLDLACMCDIRIGSQRAKLGETFVNLGIIPGDGGAWFLPRVVGMQRAAEMTFSGRIVGADEACQMGLLLEVVEPDGLMARCQDMAAGFASKPRDALRIAKRLLSSGQRMQLPDFLDYCAGMQSICHSSDEHDAALETMINAMAK